MEHWRFFYPDLSLIRTILLEINVYDYLDATVFYIKIGM